MNSRFILLFLAVFIFATLLLSSNFASAFDYVFGDTLYPYSTQTQPAKGASYIDSTFHTNIIRVTNSQLDRNSWGTTAGYSTWSPESSDGKYLIFMDLTQQGIGGGGGYVLYDANTFQYMGNFQSYIDTYLLWWNSQDPEPRWDRSGSHPTWIYYRKDKQLRYLDIADGSDHLVHDFTADFPSYGASYYIYNGEEGSPSLDSRYWVFMLRNGASPYQTVRMFTYDKTLDRIVASKDVTNHDPNNVMMSQSGKYVYVAYDWTGQENEYDGPHVYTINFTSPIKICSGIPHAVWAYDAQGNEVVFFMNTAGSYGDYVMFVRADNGAIYPLYPQENMGWDGSNVLHSAPGMAKKGGGIISSYSLQSEGGNNHWSDNQLFMFELNESKTYGSANPPRIWRLSFTQNMPGDDYYYNQPNAQFNYEGTKIWWGANWRNKNGRMDIYQLTLPETWYEDLGGSPQTLHPADTNQNNKIEMKELIAFIGLWKQGSANVNDVMTALDRWFRGV